MHTLNLIQRKCHMNPTERQPTENQLVLCENVNVTEEEERVKTVPVERKLKRHGNSTYDLDRRKNVVFEITGEI